MFEKFFSFLRCIRIDSFLFFTLRCSYSCFIHWHTKIPGAGTENRTRALTLARSQATITSYPHQIWLQWVDSNHRPQGYEPCQIPLLTHCVNTYLTFNRYSVPIFPCSISAIAVIASLVFVAIVGRWPRFNSRTLADAANTISYRFVNGSFLKVFLFLCPAYRNRTCIYGLEGRCSIH